MVEAGRDKAELPYFTDDESPSFVSTWMAQDLMEDYHFATHQQSEELYIYDGGIYKPKGETLVREEVQKRLGPYTKNHYVKESLEAVKRANYVIPEKFNNPDGSIVVENGLLNVEKRELSEHSPEHIHLAKINAKYNPEAEIDKINDFITDIVHTADKKLLQEMFGYCLLRDYPIAKAFMLLGAGANGKSTLLQLLEKFVGTENVASPSLQKLLNDRFAKINLYGKLANIHADLSSKKLEETGTFKMLTGGDVIQGEKKYQDPIKFHNYAKLIYSANELPKTTDRTEAFFRRWVIIEFPYQFPEDDKETNPNLPESIINEEEMSGLLNWALDGLERILENNSFSNTKNRRGIEQKWIMETDSLRAFLDIGCQCKTDAWVAKEDFYQAYKAFCNNHNIYVVKKGPVTKRLPTLQPTVDLYRPEVDGEQVRCWRNLEIKESFIKENDYIQDIQPLRTTSFTPKTELSNSSYKKGSSQQLDMLDMDSQSDLVITIFESVEESDFNKGQLIGHLVNNEGFEKDRVGVHVEKLIEKGDLIEKLGGVLENAI